MMNRTGGKAQAKLVTFYNFNAVEAILDGQLALNQTIRVGSSPTRRTNFNSVSPSLVWHSLWEQEQGRFKSSHGDQSGKVPIILGPLVLTRDYAKT